MDPYIIIHHDRRREKKPWLVRWYSEYDVRQGKRIHHSKSFPRRKDAEHFAAQLKEDFESGLSVTPQEITLQALIHKFLESKKNRAIATVLAYRECTDRLLSYFHPHTPVKKIRMEDAEGYISQFDFLDQKHKNRGKQISDSTISRHLRQLKTLFHKAQEWGYVKINPFEKVSLGKIRTKEWHYITPEEFHKILAVVEHLNSLKKNKMSHEARKARIIAFYSVMYGCGLRFGEAIHLVWDPDVIDFERNQIIVKNRVGTKDLPHFHVKDYESRCIPMPEWVVKTLLRAQEVAEEGCPYVFLGTTSLKRVQKQWKTLVREGRGKEWQNKNMYWNALRDFKCYCRKAGIRTEKKLTIHCLRKAYGTTLANMERAVPVQTLKELMGHSSISTTMKYYVQSVDENKKRAVEGLEKVMGIPLPGKAY